LQAQSLRQLGLRACDADCSTATAERPALLLELTWRRRGDERESSLEQAREHW